MSKVYTEADIAPRQLRGELIPYSLKERTKMAAELTSQAEIDEAEAPANARRDEYAAKLGTNDQLEALLEAELGDRTKLDALLAIYSEIKARHPKPEAGL